MKYYPKLHIVEAFQIERIESYDSEMVLYFQGGKDLIDSKTISEYLPKIGDYIVTDGNGKFIMNKAEFEHKYQTVDNAKAESVPMEFPQDKVVSESFGVEGNMVVSFVTLDNGFKLTGSSFCIETEDFSEGLGKGIAVRNAAEKLFEIESYHRMQRQFEVDQACKAFDDA